MQTSRVWVKHRANKFVPALARQKGQCIYSDELNERHGGMRRYFWLLDFNAQLIYEPFGWHDEWYVDFVLFTMEDSGRAKTYSVRDMEVDLVVQGMGPTYRIIDLDKFGDRLLSHEFALAETATVLCSVQRFVDSFLHKGAPWPPPLIQPFFSALHHYETPEKG